MLLIFFPAVEFVQLFLVHERKHIRGNTWDVPFFEGGHGELAWFFLLFLTTQGMYIVHMSSSDGSSQDSSVYNFF